jgi:hypothetical protein
MTMNLLDLFAEVEAERAADPVAFEAKYATPKSEADVRREAKADRTRNCGHCRGRGHIPQFAHISNGDCFACGGSGKW